MDIAPSGFNDLVVYCIVSVCVDVLLYFRVEGIQISLESMNYVHDDAKYYRLVYLCTRPNVCVAEDWKQHQAAIIESSFEPLGLYIRQ